MSAGIVLDPVFGNMLVNETEFSNDQVASALYQQHPEVAQLARWAQGTKRYSSLFERDRYVTPSSIFDQMKVAQDAAANDDIVAGVLESTESMAFGKMTIECEDDDEEDIWNQVADSIDLESRLREMWRELFIVSQFYAVTWFGIKNFKLRGSNPKTGVRRKKEFRGLYVPVGISLLDPLRVLPVGNMLFNQEQLVYISDDRIEQAAILSVLEGNRSSDEMISELLIGEYEPSQEERKRLGEMNISTARLFVLNPERVWRHTATRPQYQRFADVRLKSIFELLDLKHQLREQERSSLIGGTNFLILVTKGSDERPASAAELSNLSANVRSMARVPVLIGDHRLKVEIITPDQDHTLDSSRHDVIDAKISARLYQTFFSSTKGSSGDDSLKVARVIARGMESRRYMLSRQIEKYILKPTYDANEEFSDEPKMMFSPKQIALTFDAALASFMFDLRDRGDISRETILAQIDIDQDDEARKRKREAEAMDDIFQTAVPFNSPLNNPVNPGGGGVADPRAAGRTQGGNRNGGGSAPGTGQGQPPRNPRKVSD